MARSGITREQVHQAADAIAAEGENPTVLGVRKRLGSGSPNRITPWLAEWREAQDSTQSDDLPEIPQAVDNAMRHVWALAWQGAQEQLVIERKALHSARQQSEAERDEQLAEISRLDDALDTAISARAQADAVLATERQAHEQTRSEAREATLLAEERQQRIREQSAELERLRAERDDAMMQAARSEAALEPLRADLERAHEAVLKYRKESNGLPAERERLREQVDRLQSEIERERETARQGKRALDLSGKKISALERALADARQARQEAEQQLTELRIETATLRERTAQNEQIKHLIESMRGQQPTTEH